MATKSGSADIGTFVVGMLTGGVLGFLAASILVTQKMERECEEQLEEETEHALSMLRSRKNPVARLSNPRNY